MPDKKQDSPFTVTDRRPFTAEGELRKETSEEEVPQAQPAAAPKPSAHAEEAPIPQAPSRPSTPSACFRRRRKAISPPPKKISCRIHSTNCVWLTLKLRTRWLARPRRRARIPRKDEGHADRPGQRHVHGRAHHWLRLRRVPFIRSARSPHSTFGSG